MTPRNPSAEYTSRLARRVAKDLKRCGWKLAAIMRDNGSESRTRSFRQTTVELRAEHCPIRSGRPQTNGCFQRVQGTILEECWKPAFARYLVPRPTGLGEELKHYLGYYNYERAHTGRWTQGGTPATVIGAAKMGPGR